MDNEVIDIKMKDGQQFNDYSLQGHNRGRSPLPKLPTETEITVDVEIESQKETYNIPGDTKKQLTNSKPSVNRTSLLNVSPPPLPPPPPPPPNAPPPPPLQKSPLLSQSQKPLKKETPPSQKTSSLSQNVLPLPQQSQRPSKKKETPPSQNAPPPPQMPPPPPQMPPPLLPSFRPPIPTNVSQDIYDDVELHNEFEMSPPQDDYEPLDIVKASVGSEETYM